VFLRRVTLVTHMSSAMAVYRRYGILQGSDVFQKSKGT
jgi:hypothetical protein